MAARSRAPVHGGRILSAEAGDDRLFSHLTCWVMGGFISHGGSPVVTIVVSILKWSWLGRCGGYPVFGNLLVWATPNVTSTLLVMIFLGETVWGLLIFSEPPPIYFWWWLVTSTNRNERGCLIWTGDCIIVISAGWWFGTCFIFHFTYGMSSETHWRTHIFQRGRYTTNQSGLVFNKKETGWWFGTLFIFPYIGNYIDIYISCTKCNVWQNLEPLGRTTRRPCLSEALRVGLRLWLGFRLDLWGHALPSG